MIPNVVGICPTVERQDLVRQLVNSYRETCTGPPPPLVVVATGADDGTEGWCKNQGEQGMPLAIIRNVETWPYAKAVNFGVKYALEQAPQTEWLLLLNNDLILQTGFWESLEEMISLGYEIIGAKLLYPLDYKSPAAMPEIPADVHRIQHFGKVFSLDARPFHILRYQPETHPQAQQPRPFPDVTFACVGIKRHVWDGVGGLDEEYTNGYEDDDFCLKARENGAQIGVHPGMRAIHLEAQTSGLDSANKAQQWLRFSSIWVDTGRLVWPLGVWPGWANP